MLHAFDRGDIDGFYGEPAEHDESLMVELIVVDTEVAAFDDDAITAPVHRLREVALAAETIAVEGLNDEWFGNFDENAEHHADTFEDEPTTTWEKIGVWLKNFGRAA